MNLFIDTERLMSKFKAKLICPETGLIFCDPVRIEGSDRVYERIMIKHWISLGHSECPQGTPIAPNTKLVMAQDIQEDIRSSLTEHLSHWQVDLYQSYQQAKAKWQMSHNCSDENGFVISQLDYFKQNAHNAQCQRIAFFMLSLSGMAIFALGLNHAFLWLTIGQTLLHYTATFLALITTISFAAWFSPPQSKLLMGLLPSTHSSAHKDLCVALEYIWNPQSHETSVRYAHSFQDAQAILQARIYALSFAQLVLGCPDLNMFNISHKKALPTTSHNGKEYHLLNQHSGSSPYNYWQFEKNLLQLKAFKKHPESLSFPNNIPLPLRPFQGLVLVSHDIVNACFFSTPLPAPQKSSSEPAGPLSYTRAACR